MSVPGFNSPIPQASQAAQPPREVMATTDPLGLGPATNTVLQRAAGKPFGLLRAATRYAVGVTRTSAAAVARAAGVETDPVVEPEARDRRFKDLAWSENPVYFSLQQQYLLACQLAEDILEAGRSDQAEDLDDQKAAFLVRLLAEVSAPTNFALTNPEVLIRAFQTGGKSLLKGAANVLEDLANNDGMPQQVDNSGFSLGENLAVTPGRVIYRNELIELIQYAPQTEKVHEVPIVCSPPWINKYYVMDLAPERSFVEWAVQHERTVFMISYRDPDVSLQDMTMSDYLEKGVLTALDVVQEITGAPKVDLVGLCLGGAMASMAAAHLAARKDERLNTLSTFNTHVDYSTPGELAIMVDDETLERLKLRMEAKGGVLPARDMATAFDLLRPRDLVFRYVPTRWLMGEDAPAFDVLAWNVDSVRMPAKMHTEYLHELYGRNKLARGEYELAGQLLDLAKVKVDTYVVGAINDHIVPWHSSFLATDLLGGKVRYILSNGGHIAGIVNPPGPKAWYESLPAGQDDTTGAADIWRKNATKTQGSWWEDWVAWSNKRAGKLVAPPASGSNVHRPIGEAPGRYVKGLAA